MATEQDLEGCVQYLTSKHILVQREWVEACLEWVLAESQVKPIPCWKLHELIYEQWLMADLQEISIPCLKQDHFKENGHGLLQGNFMLQVNYSVNINESAFSQYQRLKGMEIDESVEGPEIKQDFRDSKQKYKPSRMIFLLLTDGSTEIEAIEYSQIPGFDKMLEPGCKIHLRGPISFFDGLLLLRNENVSILGGNAEDLNVKFSRAALLKTTLGITDENTPPRLAGRLVEASNIGIKNNNTADMFPFQDDDDIFDDVPAFELFAPTDGNINSVKSSNFIKDDFRVAKKSPFDPESISTVNADVSKADIQTDSTNASYKGATEMLDPSPTIPDFVNDSKDLEDFTEDCEVFSKAGEGFSSRLANSSFTLNSTQNEINSLVRAVDVTGDPTFTNQTNKNNAPPTQYKKFSESLAEDRVTTLNTILKFEESKQTTFRAKVRVSSLVSQLRTSPSYFLKVQLSDGTGKLEATLDPKVITQIIGYSAEELERFKTTHPRLRKSVKQAVMNSQRKLASALWFADIVKLEGEQRSSYKITSMNEMT